MNPTARHVVDRRTHDDDSPRHRPGLVQAEAIVRSTAVGLIYLAAAGLGAGFSFDFGMRAGGTWLAVIAAVQGAVFATLMVDAMRDGVRRRRRQDTPAASVRR
jgi:hypothetical protein